MKNTIVLGGLALGLVLGGCGNDAEDAPCSAAASAAAACQVEVSEAECEAALAQCTRDDEARLVDIAGCAEDNQCQEDQVLIACGDKTEGLTAACFDAFFALFNE